MNNIIANCLRQWKNPKHCSLTPTCKGWGCRFLGTPIEELPTTDKEKAKLFSKVYREAETRAFLSAHIIVLCSLMKCLKT